MTLENLWKKVVETKNRRQTEENNSIQAKQAKILNMKTHLDLHLMYHFINSLEFISYVPYKALCKYSGNSHIFFSKVIAEMRDLTFNNCGCMFCFIIYDKAI